jgi:hypothetical protein
MDSRPLRRLKVANETVIVNELDDETMEILIEEEQKAIKLLNIMENETPKQIVEKIKKMVDEIIVKNCSGDELDEYSFELGIIFGKMIEKEYNWNWKNIDYFGDGDIQLYIVSPKEYYLGNPLNFVYKILTENNIENNILELFNILNGIEKQEPEKKYQRIL